MPIALIADTPPSEEARTSSAPRKRPSTAAFALRPKTCTPPAAPSIDSGDAYVPRLRPLELRSMIAPLSPRVATYRRDGSSLRPPVSRVAEPNTIRSAVLSSTRTWPPPASAPICVPW